MLAVERTQYIMDALKEKKVVMVGDLSKEMNVSEETIRRDLEKVEKQGLICRVHGGAYLKEGYGNETPITVREKIYQKEKAEIATCCVALIEDQDSIILDCSTTAVYIAKELVHSNKKVTVITNSLSVATELSRSESVRLIMLGGELRPSTNSFCGRITENSLKDYFADKAFISSAGISLQAGVSDYTQEEASIRKKMISRSKVCYFAADVTKIERSAVNKVADLSEVDCLIVNLPIQTEHEEFQKELERLKIKTIICSDDNMC